MTGFMAGKRAGRCPALGNKIVSLLPRLAARLVLRCVDAYQRGRGGAPKAGASRKPAGHGARH